MKALVLVVLVAGCAGDLVEPWELDHDRIIAVRATPPRIPAEATAQLDVLVAHAEAKPTTRAPDAAHVVSPASLASALAGATITAPSETALAAARGELGLSASAPVPLVISMMVNGFTATKTVWLGEAADNPPLVGLQIANTEPAAELVLPADTNVPLEVLADDSTDNVTWLTSCGTMHDFDLSRAYLRIEPDDAQVGELVLVLRDPRGGVTWRVWPVRAE
jgi:hypothetical protein